MASRVLPKPISSGSGSVSRRMTVPESSGPRCASVAVTRSKSCEETWPLRVMSPTIPHTERIQIFEKALQ